MTDYDPDFVVALKEIFGLERAGRALDDEDATPVETLHELWKRALDHERRHAFQFMRKYQTQYAKEVDPNLSFLAWVVANGTYRGALDPAKRPWWLESDDNWKNFVADRLRIEQVSADLWHILVQETDEMAGLLVRDEGHYEVRYYRDYSDHRSLEGVRRFADYKSAMADIVAHQVMRENSARQSRKSEPENEPEFGEF